jgi:hypothetical protein
MLHGQAMSTPAPAAREHFAAVGGFAPLEESVPAEAAPPSVLS